MTTAGTPVPFIGPLIAQGRCLAGDVVAVNKIFAIPIPSNQGTVYVGLQGMNKATLQGVIFTVPPGGGFSITNPVGLNVYHVEDYWVDADNSGEGIGGSIDQV